LSYILKVNSENLDGFRRLPCDPYNHFTAEKVGGACSISAPKVSGALAPLALYGARTPWYQTVMSDYLDFRITWQV